MTTTTTTTTAPAPAALSAAVPQASGAKLTVDLYANAVLNQPPLTLDGLDNLGPALNTAQGNAKTWVSTTSPEIILRVTDVVGFGDTWAAFTSTIENLVANIDVDGNRAELVQVLQAMRDNHLAPLELSAQSTASDVTALGVLFASDKAAMDALLSQGTALYEGDSGKIAELKSANDSLQHAMSQLTDLIAGSATAIVVGGLAVAVGALAELPTAGASTAVIAGGALLIAGGIAGVSAGAVLYNKDVDAYAANLVLMANDKSAMAQLTGMHGQVSSLSNSNAAAQTALSAVASSWTAIKGMFDNMIIDVNEATLIPEIALQDIQAATLDWQSLTTLSNALAQNFGVPTAAVDLSQPAHVVVKDAA